MILNNRVIAARRAALLGSAAFAAIATATPALAQDGPITRPDIGPS